MGQHQLRCVGLRAVLKRVRAPGLSLTWILSKQCLFTLLARPDWALAGPERMDRFCLARVDRHPLGLSLDSCECAKEHVVLLAQDYGARSV